jgi:glycosyltransferase involved in cell wall biosynthesis
VLPTEQLISHQAIALTMSKILSIITITYNAEAVLERTLKSVFGQTCQDFEYIIIDGASKDGTLVMANNYLVPNIYSEPDKGIYDAMNKGLDKASGQYVWFMNAGDQIASNTVVEQLLEQIKVQPADVYYSDTQVVNNEGAVLGLRTQTTPHALPKELTWQSLRYGMVVCHQSFIVKRSIAPAYLLEHPYSADIDWEIKCLKKAKKAVLVPFALSKYLVGGFSVQNLKASLLDRYQILKSHYGLVPTILAHIIIFVRGGLFAIKKKGRYW